MHEDSNMKDNSIQPTPFASLQCEQKQSNGSVNPLMFTYKKKVENNLLKLVSDMNVPNDVYKKV